MTRRTGPDGLRSRYTMQCRAVSQVRIFENMTGSRRCLSVSRMNWSSICHRHSIYAIIVHVRESKSIIEVQFLTHFVVWLTQPAISEGHWSLGRIRVRSFRYSGYLDRFRRRERRPLSRRKRSLEQPGLPGNEVRDKNGGSLQSPQDQTRNCTIR